MEQLEKELWETPVEMTRLRRFQKTRAWKMLFAVLVMTGLGIIAYQIPGLIAAFRDPKPVRMGTYETDETTDRCIRNLWQQAYLVQQGRSDAARYVVCPATGRPYVFKREPDQEIHCPNPDRHGFRDIVVTRLKPVPALYR
jgi:hypothetical protein